MPKQQPGGAQLARDKIAEQTAMKYAEIEAENQHLRALVAQFQTGASGSGSGNDSIAPPRGGSNNDDDEPNERQSGDSVAPPSGDATKSATPSSTSSNEAAVHVTTAAANAKVETTAAVVEAAAAAAAVAAAAEGARGEQKAMFRLYCDALQRAAAKFGAVQPAAQASSAGVAASVALTMAIENLSGLRSVGFACKMVVAALPSEMQAQCQDLPMESITTPQKLVMAICAATDWIKPSDDTIRTRGAFGLGSAGVPARAAAYVIALQMADRSPQPARDVCDALSIALVDLREALREAAHPVYLNVDEALHALGEQPTPPTEATLRALLKKSAATIERAKLTTAPAAPVAVVHSSMPLRGGGSDGRRRGGSSRGRGGGGGGTGRTGTAGNCYRCNETGHIWKSCDATRCATCGGFHWKLPCAGKQIEKKGLYIGSLQRGASGARALSGRHNREAFYVVAESVLTQAGASATAERVLVDLGAVPSVTTSAFVAEYALTLTSSTTPSIYGVNGATIDVVGCVRFALRISGATLDVDALVVESAPFRLLIGCDTLRGSNVRAHIIIGRGRGRLRLDGGRWAEAVDWHDDDDDNDGDDSRPAAPTPVLLVAPAAEFTSRPSSFFAFVPKVGLLHAKSVIGDDEGLTVADAMSILGFTAAPPVTTTTTTTTTTDAPVFVVSGQAAAAAAAIRAHEASVGAERAGAWQLPDMRPHPSAALPYERPTGADTESYRDIRYGPQLPPEIRRQLEASAKQFKHVFGGGGGVGASGSAPVNKAGRSIKLTLIPGADLKDITASYRPIDPDDAAFLEKYARQMLADGRLVEIDHAPATSLAMVVRKADGSQRVVVNFAPLNRMLIGNHAAMPNIHQLHRFLADGDVRSTFDLWQCFHQFALDERSIPLTATWFGPDMLLAWVVAPMGIVNVPNDVQQVMRRTFDNKYTRTFIDDLGQRCKVSELVAATRHIYETCDRLGWTLKAKKVCIGFVQLPMLGKLIGPGTIDPKPEHLQGVADFALPKTKRALQGFRGMVTALAPHLRDATRLMQPLNEAIATQHGRLDWSPRMLEAFHALRRLVLSPESVVPFDAERPLIVITDWSTQGWSATLAHLSADETHFELVDAMARANTRAGARRTPAVGELAAFVLASKAFPHYMRGRTIYWLTDSMTMKQALQSLRTSKVPMVGRLVEQLAQLDVVVMHSAGEENVIADTLCRQFERPADDADDADDVDDVVDDDVDNVPQLAAMMTMKTEETTTTSALPVWSVNDDDDDDNSVAASLSAAAASLVELQAAPAAAANAPARPAAAAAAAPAAAAATVVPAAAAAPAQVAAAPTPTTAVTLSGVERALVSASADEKAAVAASAVAVRERIEQRMLRWLLLQANDAELRDYHVLARAVAGPATAAVAAAAAAVAAAGSLAALEPHYDASGLLCVRIDGDARIVVPAGAVTEVVDAVHSGEKHDGIGMAHWHARRCLLVAREIYWWRTMAADVGRWCHECVACQRHRHMTSREPANLGNSEATREPVRLREWQLDSFVLDDGLFFTAIELYSGFVMTAALTDHSSAEFVRAFETTVVQAFDTPTHVVVDGGSEMMRHFDAYCSARGIEIVVGQPYNPRAVARVSRAQRQLLAAVTKARALGSTAPIAQLMARAAHEWNIAPIDAGDDDNNRAGLYSPHRLMFASAPRHTSTALLPMITVPPSSPHRPLQDVLNELTAAHAAATAVRAADRAERRKRHVAAFAQHRAPPAQLVLGDDVWACVPPDTVEGNKLEQHQRWTGPWRVTAINAVTGVVQLAWLADVDVPLTVAVHLRNTRSFIAPQPLDAPHLLDNDSVWASGDNNNRMPLGGMSELPPTVRAKFDAALAASGGRRTRAATLTSTATSTSAVTTVEAAASAAATAAAKEKAAAIAASTATSSTAATAAAVPTSTATAVAPAPDVSMIAAEIREATSRVAAQTKSKEATSTIAVERMAAEQAQRAQAELAVARAVEAQRVAECAASPNEVTTRAADEARNSVQLAQLAVTTTETSADMAAKRAAAARTAHEEADNKWRHEAARLAAMRAASTTMATTLSTTSRQ